MSSRTLRSSSSASSLPRLRPVASTSSLRATPTQPSLAELVQDEVLLERHHLAHDAGDGAEVRGAARQQRRSSAPSSTGPNGAGGARPRLRPADLSPAPVAPMPQSALLLPPHYGRPSRPSSPDVLAALLRPVLRSLSRPSSPALSPVAPRSPESSSPTKGSLDLPFPDAELADRSASSLPAQFPPREPTDPAPTVESQGFVLYIGSLVAYVAYLVWAFLPEEWLEAIGIEWYPARDWALLVPAWIVMLVVYIYTGYFALNLYSTPPLDSIELLDDPRAFVSPPRRPPPSTDGKPRPPTPLWAHALLLPDDAIPPLYDLPMDVVNRVLYGD